MADIPKVPEKYWHTDMTTEVQPITDRNERRSASEKRSKKRKRPDGEQDEDRTTDKKDDEQRKDSGERTGDTDKKEQRCEDEPGQVIDFEA